MRDFFLYELISRNTIDDDEKRNFIPALNESRLLSSGEKK